MDEANLVAVEATDERYRVLRHMPSGAGFDENGRGLWPSDQFTYRLRQEGSIRIVDPRPPAPQPDSDDPVASRRKG